MIFNAQTSINDFVTCLSQINTSLTYFLSEKFVVMILTGLEDVTEVISVVRIGVSLVEYIYKVFSAILKDSGGGEVDKSLKPFQFNNVRKKGKSNR